jgi:UDPglucose--hexose-1-phosphate uridylyltransferase
MPDAVPEVRIDPINGLRVLVADDRNGRPNAQPQFPELDPIDSATDPFAEGNESETPPEVWADRPGDSPPNGPGWRVRSVPNKFPALDQSLADSGELGDPLGAQRGMPDLHVKGPAHGIHEVIINAPGPVSCLGDLSLSELRVALAAWANRIGAHADRAAYVHLCVNERVEAGSTIAHTHAQLFALSFVPPLIARERERMRAYFEHTQGRNLMEDLLIEEVRSNQRLVAIDDDAALIAPFASATPYRLAVIPRKPEPRFDQSESHGATMLHTALFALRKTFGIMPPLNIWIRTAPEGAESYTWRIEIAPRLTQPAGFELGTGASINSVAPETAAAHLRDSLK